MSTLRSGLEEMQAQDLRYAGDGDLEADLLEIERAAGVLEVERSRRVAAIRERGSYRRDGHLSVGAFLGHLLRISRPSAERYLRWARAFQKMPITRQALSCGEITSSAASVLVGAAEAHPEAFGQAEELLVDAARSLPASSQGPSPTGARPRTPRPPRSRQSAASSSGACTSLPPSEAW